MKFRRLSKNTSSDSSFHFATVSGQLNRFEVSGFLLSFQNFNFFFACLIEVTGIPATLLELFLPF